jgi:polyhydroxyalkanoate synthesis regulator phasin
VLDSLVSDETLTEDEASSVAQSLQPPPPPPPGGMMPMQGTSEDSESDTTDMITQTLQSLVDDGTLTDDQVTAITDALTGSSETDTDSDSTTLQSILDNLVENDTLTEDEAATVAQSLIPPPPPGQMYGLPFEMSGDSSGDESAGAVTL